MVSKQRPGASNRENGWHQRLPVWLLLLAVAAIIFIAEVGIHTALYSFVGDRPLPLLSLADGLLAVLLVYPALFFLLIQPLRAEIARRRQTESLLRVSEAKHRAIFDAANDGIFILDPETGVILDVNLKVQEMYGYSAEEVRRLTIEGISAGEPPYTQQEALRWMRRAADGEPQLFEWLAKGRSGRLFWVEVNMKRASIGDRDCLLAVERDICERKRAAEERDRLLAQVQEVNQRLVTAGVRQQQLAEEAEDRARQLETLIEAVPDGILVVDREGNVVAINSAFLRSDGIIDRQEMLRPIADYQQFFQTLYPDGRPVPLADWPVMRALRGERVSLMQMLRRDWEGREWQVQVSAAPVLDEKGQVLQAVAVVRDVTEQRRAERRREVLAAVGQALSQKLDLEVVLQTVMDQAQGVLGADAAAIFMAEPDGRALELAGYRGVRPESLERVRHLTLDIPLATVRAFLSGEIQVIADLKPEAADPAGVYAFLVAEGMHSLLATPLRTGGRPVGVLTLATRSRRQFDAQDQETVAQVGDLCGVAIENARLYEETRRWAEDLEEGRRRREQFISVVAHELRGPLTVLLGYAGMLNRREEPVEWDRLQRFTEVMEEQVHKLNRLVGDLLDFSRIEAGRFTIDRASTDLTRIALRVVEEQQATTTNHRLILETPKRSIEGLWDKDRVAQALTNLISNAIKYSPEGGEVRVVVRQANGAAEVRVRDHGIGIAREDITLLFQPYSRLYRERRARGVGLGLYITKGIVEAHGGRLWVESEIGQGSTFGLTLPLGPTPPPE